MIGNEAAANLRGAALMSLCMAAFVSNDTLMRSIAGELPVPQALFVRGAGVTLILAILALWRRGSIVMPPRRDMRLILLRSVGEVMSGIAVVISLYHMELAMLTAIALAAPLAITLAAAVFLRAPVGWRRLTAILTGFLGVLVILRPGLSGFSLWSLVALVSVLGVTVRDLCSREISGATSPLLVVLCGSIAVTSTAFLWSLSEGWVPVPPRVALHLGAGAVALVCAYLLAVASMRSGEIAVVTPFRYTSLLWALLSGVVLLGEIPDLTTLLGAAIIVASGGYALWREIRHAPGADTATEVKKVA